MSTREQPLLGREHGWSGWAGLGARVVVSARRAVAPGGCGGGDVTEGKACSTLRPQRKTDTKLGSIFIDRSDHRFVFLFFFTSNLSVTTDILWLKILAKKFRLIDLNVLEQF